MFGYFFPAISAVAELLLFAILAGFVIDFVLLFRFNSPISASRFCTQRLSNGDQNPIQLKVESYYPFVVDLTIIDEIPHQFQVRDFNIKAKLEANDSKNFNYSLRPTQRGNYQFGKIRVFVNTFLDLVNRRLSFDEEFDVAVYPSFIQMRKFEMYAISNRLTDVGIKKIRRIGHTMEFDQIRNYVIGDDVRSINWKATARSSQLMINQYQDQKSQQIVNVIDTGRVMKMPFDGLHLLDYAINTSLVLSNIAVIKEDKAGLLTFSNKKANVVLPDKKRTHVQKIQEALYKIETNFLESDFERLLIGLKASLKQRSLVLLYTNFETYSAMERQLPYLRRIAKDHLLVCIFFENTELTELQKKESVYLSDIYTKTIAEKFIFEKKQIVKTLNRYGIQTILTPPKDLSINAINKYLELKSRGAI